MTLREQIAADVAAVFFNESDALWETIIYYPETGEARTIRAHVFRDVPEVIDGLPRGGVFKFVLAVKDNGTTGIARSELRKGRDRIGVADYEGGELVSRGIAAVREAQSDQDGMLVLEVG